MNKLKEKIRQIQTLTLSEFLFHYGKILAIAVGLAVAVIAISIFLFWQKTPNTMASIEEQPTTVLDTEMSEESQPMGTAISSISEISQVESVSQQWYVDIKGAVAAPQVYPVDQDMRIHDVIDIAGGLTIDADGSRLNFSQKVADQMVIYVPRLDEEVPSEVQGLTMQTSAVESDGSQSTNLININTADANQLQDISGIGEKKAADIIAYRDSNGRFQSVDDLVNVSGIGEKSLENMRPQVTVN